MRKSGGKHSKGKRNRRNFLFAVIFMIIVFSFCGCGETTNTVSSDLEEKMPEKEEVEEKDFSENTPISLENDEQKKDSMEDAGQKKEDLTASDSQAQEDLTADDNQTKEESVTTESQTNDTSVTSESVEISRESAEEIVEEPVAVSAGTDYILNTNTKKFHYPDCSSVGQMKEKNKWAYNGNRDDVIAMGYVPCKRCNP